MTPNPALTTEPPASWWLRRIAPALILLCLSALILAPSVIHELANPPLALGSGDQAGQ
jgi:hypothetical protein